MNLSRFEHKIFSQNGEDGVIAILFGILGTRHRYCLEIACDGRECNTRLLRQLGWRRLAFDKSHSDPGQGIHKAHVTAENINDLLRQHQCPPQIDFLSFDVDGIDWYLWRALEATKPRVLCIEYNASYAPGLDMLIPYDPAFEWNDETTYFGASLDALCLLGLQKGYVLVYCEASGNNAFFIDAGEASRVRNRQSSEWWDLWHPPTYGPQGHGHAPCDQSRPWTSAYAELGKEGWANTNPY
jgi:hypothetical protein